MGNYDRNASHDVYHFKHHPLIARMSAVLKIFRVTAPLMIASVVATGCVSSTNYASVQEAMRGSPELLDKATRDCASSYRASSEAKEYIAALMRVPNDANMPNIMCTRLYKGISAGRISYDDFQSMFTGQVKPVVIRVLQNR